MNLYHISQNENSGYDTYSDAVVAAEDDVQARHIHPSGDGLPLCRSLCDGWASSPENVTAELIGTAVEGAKAGVICASFHAS